MIPELNEDKKYWLRMPEGHDKEYRLKLEEEMKRVGYTGRVMLPLSSQVLAIFVDRGRVFWDSTYQNMDATEDYAQRNNYEEFDLILEPTRTIDLSGII